MPERSASGASGPATRWRSSSRPARSSSSRFFGALAIGAVPVPLYPTLEPELKARVFRNCEARAVVTIDWFRADVEAAQAGAPDLRHLLTPDVLETRDAPFAAPIRAAEDDRLLPPVHLRQHLHAPRRRAQPPQRDGHRPDHGRGGGGDADRPAGELAAALPRHGAHRPRLRSACTRAPPSCSCRPTSATLARGSSRSPSTGRHVTVSPDFGYRNCVRHIHDTTGLDLSSLRMALSGAEPVRLSTIQAFQERFGVGDIFAPAYGLAEATLAVAIWPHGQPLRVDAVGRFVSVGRPCRGVRVEIAGPDGAGRARPGEVGEILVQSPGVMQGYYSNPEATARVSPRRVAPHRRPGIPRRRGLPLRHRPHQGRDHPGRPERRPGRHRGGRGPRRRRPLLGRRRHRERAHRHPAAARGRRGAGRRADGRGARRASRTT